MDFDDLTSIYLGSEGEWGSQVTVTFSQFLATGLDEDVGACVQHVFRVYAAKIGLEYSDLKNDGRERLLKIVGSTASDLNSVASR